MRNLGIYIAGVLCMFLIMSCDNEYTLQKYFVDHQNDTDFVSVDVPSSLLNKDGMNLNAEEQEALNSIHKVNLLILPFKEEKKDKFEKERTDIAKILSTETYETLIRFGSNDTKIAVKSIAKDENVNEIIVFVTDFTKGLGVVRILGDNMRSEKIVKLVRSAEEGRLDFGAFKDIADSITIE